jgi:predicted RNA-binding Zn-ribbon protein involved in translation (DUF1610 family)
MNEEDDSYIHKEDTKPRQFSGSTLTSGNTQSFACPSCGSYNTIQGVYFEECKTCGWNQGY